MEGNAKVAKWFLKERVFLMIISYELIHAFIREERAFTSTNDDEGSFFILLDFKLYKKGIIRRFGSEQPINGGSFVLCSGHYISLLH